MRGKIHGLWLAGAVALLPGCGQPGSGTPPAEPPGRPSAAGGAREVATKSGVAMILVPGGEFLMGNARGNPDEAPAHKVKISAFLMDQYEVTQDLFAKAQLPNPSHWGDQAKKPVERVRWRDAKQYCNERSLLEGLKPCYDEKTADWACNYAASGYRLPTEAEWEYACRAGTDGPYDFGPAARLKQHGWFAENADEKTHLAGQKKPNAWGFHDLYGNVAEWCEDVYSPTYYAESPAADPTGPPGQGRDVKRVMRGGSWKASADMCRATYRQGERTGDTDACFYTDYCGFRCVRRPAPEEMEALKSAGR